MSLNAITTEIFLYGQPCDYIYMNLDQRMYGHHTFEIAVNCQLPPRKEKRLGYHRRRHFSEVGDQVMIGFLQDDPNRPYVMGSMYHMRNTKGVAQDNAVRSMITRSGIKVACNDNEGSAHIEYPNGSTYDMDGKGSIAVFENEILSVVNLQEVQKRWNSISKDLLSKHPTVTMKHVRICM